MDLTTINLLISCTAVTASVAGPIATFAIGRAQIRANVLSANRQRWIDGFRDLISSFCSQVSAAAIEREKLHEIGISSLADNPAMLIRFEMIGLATTKIRLMTNVQENNHRQLVVHIDRVRVHLKTPPVDRHLSEVMDDEIQEIVRLTQTILKHEWMRVKRGR